MFLRLLCSVDGATALSPFDPRRVENTAHDPVPDAGKVFHASPTHEDNRMFLEGMPFPGNVRRDFHPVREPYPSELSESGIRFPRRHRAHFDTDAALKWTSFSQRDGAILEDVEHPAEGRHF